MTSAEFSGSDNEELPILTQEVIDRLRPRDFSAIEVSGRMAQSDPILYERVEHFLEKMTLEQKIAGLSAAAYVYFLLNEAQKAKR